MNVLVTGGTGALGRRVVEALRARGHRAVVLSRRAGEGPDWRQGDLAAGTGIAAALAGQDAVVHAGSATLQPWKYRVTDVEGTRRLLRLAADAGVSHVAYVSIVGMEGVAYPYFRYKLAAEAEMRRDVVPWSILRATQFHTLMEIYLGLMSRLPGLMTVPYSWRFQPVDTADVAARLVEALEGGPGGLLPDFGGPEVRDFRSIAESWRRSRRLRRRLVNLPLPFKASRQFAAGRMLCPEHADGTVTWEQYLERKYG